MLVKIFCKNLCLGGHIVLLKIHILGVVGPYILVKMYLQVAFEIILKTNMHWETLENISHKNLHLFCN